MVTANPKKLLFETHVGDIVVVSAVVDCGYETRVLGGQLDGWTQSAQTLVGARYNHKWVCRLVQEGESPSGLVRRQEMESN